ncbi:MAG: glycoside hydrolase family 3 C-terminal domain-containing protein [Gammaproteobacteria bacterium]|nr:glycoside hydrolase family 3 C-terminal domain-containing protein [Gammaproteobacteria bacterium]
MLKIHGKTKKFVSKLSKEKLIDTLYIKENGQVGPAFRKGSLNIYEGGNMVYPSTSSIATSFDKELIREMYEEEINDAISLKKKAFITPPLTLKRNPYAGKSYDYISEDPTYNSIVVGEVLNKALDKKVVPIVDGLLKSDQEYAKYNISYSIDEKNLFENYINPLNNLPKNERVILTLPSHKVNNLYVHNNPELIDRIIKETSFNGLLSSSKNSNIEKSALINNGVALSYEDEKVEVIDGPLKTKATSFARKVTEIARESLKVKGLKHENSPRFNALINANSNVLLKNESNILPLGNEKILLVGFYQELPLISGDLSVSSKTKTNSLYYEFSKYSNKLSYIKLYDKHMNIIKEDLDKLLKVAKDFDKIVIVLSNADFYQRDGIDATSLSFKDEIYGLYKKLRVINSNIVTVLELTRRCELKEIEKYSKAILLSYPGGEGMNSGITMNLFSLVPPSGRLTESFANDYSDYLVAINHNLDKDERLQSESIYTGYKYYDKVPKNLLYPFGYGLSYSKFEIKSATISKRRNYINVSATIKNIGNSDSFTPIMLFYSFKDSDTFRPIKTFLDFDKVFIEKKKEKKINLQVPLSRLKVYDYIDDKLILEDGAYDFSLCLSSHEMLYTKTIKIKTYEKIKDDIRFTSKPYFIFNEQTFSIPLFYKIYQRPYPKEKSIVIEDLTLAQASNLIKEAKYYNEVLEVINSVNNASKKYIYKHYLMSYPLRLLHKYVDIISKDRYDEIVKEIKDRYQSENTTSK